MSYGIRHKGRCCPEYDCLYESWDGVKCRGCGADCKKCIEENKMTSVVKVNKVNGITLERLEQLKESFNTFIWDNRRTLGRDLHKCQIQRDMILVLINECKTGVKRKMPRWNWDKEFENEEVDGNV